MKEITFIHASDIHLGHQQFNLEQRFHDFGAAFQIVVQEALDKQVDFVIIGGDFFHKRAIDARTLKQAMTLLEPLKEARIPVIAIEGNHDKAFYQEKSSWLNLLNSLGYLKLLKPQYEEGKMLLSEWNQEQEVGCITDVNGIRIIGLGYLGATTGQRLAEVAEELDKDNRFTVLMLHAAVDKLLGQDLGGVKKEVLEAFKEKVDYIALGHIHTRQEIDEWVFNPGSLENCHIDEAKEHREKGYYVVTVRGQEKSIEYRPSTPRLVKLVTVDITGAANPSEVNDKLQTEIEKLGIIGGSEQPMLQVILKGEIEFSTLAIDVAALTKEIKNTTGCLYVEIQNQANLPTSSNISGDIGQMNRAEIERQVLKKLVSNQCPDYREYSNELVDLIIKVKEAALKGEAGGEIAAEVTLMAKELPDLKQSEDQVASARESKEEGDTFETEEN